MEDVTKNPPIYCNITPSAINQYQWNVAIRGPPESYYHGGIFFLCIRFPVDYPFKAPQVFFTTRIFHPSIDRRGRISLAILRSWRAGQTISKGYIIHICLTIILYHTNIYSVLLSICDALCEPEIDGPLMPHIANIFTTDRYRFGALAREWTEKYANYVH